ncbi:hypothetical protein C3L33_19936, partial [Rhododendron williamsianum]
MAGGGADARSGVRIVVAGDRGTGKSSLIATAAARTIEHGGNWPNNLNGLMLSCLLMRVKVPVIVVGCKLDLRDDKHPLNLEQVMSPIMQQFQEIETCIECSAFKQIQEAQTLKPQCLRALKQIFILCDHDRDGALSDAELNDFQVKCFNAPLQPSEIVGVKRVVQETLPEGVNDLGLTLTGFFFLHALFIEKGRHKTTWTVLRKFRYDNDIRLSDDHLPPPVKRAPDQLFRQIEWEIDKHGI